jgi:hypothetical protein
MPPCQIHAVFFVGGAVHVDTVVYGVMVDVGALPSNFSAFTKTGITCPVLKEKGGWLRTKWYQFCVFLSLFFF